jgi:DNA polymerase-3 subunit alpha
VALDIDAVPLDDAKTYRVFQEGATHGIFQFESSGMRELLRKARPERLDDLIALNALYRPGPLKSGMVDNYIACKQGTKEVKYDLPQLAPILQDTYGVIAYQEQVMLIAQALAGFSLAQADMLRKAMGKKDPKVMAKMRADFMAGAGAKGVNEKKATKIFDLMEYFAGYGFNKSHSTAYAYLAYRTAYLKANYPWHFAAALLTIEAQNADKLATYLGECRDRGVPVLPPDINQSQLRFSVEPGRGVRFGLTAIKGLGEGAIESILQARAALDGRIPSLHALCEILDMRLANKRVFEALVKSGACDSLLPAAGGERIAVLARDRARLFAAIESATEHGARTQRDKALGQSDLFGGGDAPEAAPVQALPDVAPWSEVELLNHERDTLGLFLTGHPVDRWADDLRDFGARSIASLGIRRAADQDGHEADEGEGAVAPPVMERVSEDVAVGGIVSGLRLLKTRKGDRMCVFMLDDRDGGLEVVVFPEAFKGSGHLAENGAMLLVKGKFERDAESARLVAAELQPIERVREKLSTAVSITLHAPGHGRQTFEQLWEVLARHKGDRRVALYLQDDDRGLRVNVKVNAQIRVRPSERLVADVEQICGTGSVRLR